MAGHRHDTTRHVLVTARKSDTCIVMLSTSDGFDTVGDDLTALE